MRCSQSMAIIVYRQTTHRADASILLQVDAACTHAICCHVKGLVARSVQCDGVEPVNGLGRGHTYVIDKN
jgi:hypothetical protein